MAKTPKKPVFCYFFPFFHILESNFRPILPHRVFLTYSGVVLCRLWPLYAKKWQNELLLHNFLRGLRPLGGGGKGERARVCVFVCVSLCLSFTVHFHLDSVFFLLPPFSPYTPLRRLGFCTTAGLCNIYCTVEDV